jgi:plasmid stabilization system protein ParE
MTYVLSPIAEQDIDEIISYLALENPEAAYDLVDALYDSFEKLAQNPYLGHVRDDLTAYPVRFWTFKWHYLVIYAPEDPLQIIRVLSGYRDIQNLI